MTLDTTLPFPRYNPVSGLSTRILQTFLIRQLAISYPDSINLSRFRDWLLDVVGFHQADAGCVIHAAENGGVIARHEG